MIIHKNNNNQVWGKIQDKKSQLSQGPKLVKNELRGLQGLVKTDLKNMM